MDSKITAIRAQTKNPNRVNIFIDGDYGFSLAKIVAAWLKVGQTLDQEQIDRLQKEDALEKAFQRAVHFISYRPRSISEVEKKLSDAGYERDVIQKIIKRLMNDQILGDENFADQWIENRLSTSPRGRRALVYELRKKGIDEKIIEESLSGIENESSLALKAARKYAGRLASYPYAIFKNKLLGFLARRGFRYGDIVNIVSQVWNELKNTT